MSRIIEECVQALFVFIFVVTACLVVSEPLFFYSTFPEIAVAAIAGAGTAALYLNRKLRTK